MASCRPASGTISETVFKTPYPTYARIADSAAEPVRDAGTSKKCLQMDAESSGDSRTDLNDLIQKASKAHNVDAGLVSAVIRAESNFNPTVNSPKGAMGLMQLMPETAKELGVENPYDPEENIMGGVRYLRMLLDRYAGNVKNALAAYNWGMGNLEKNSGRLPEETRGYIAKVMKYYEGVSV
jgi:soluble lytic murein transglycosylase-like protein